MFFKTIFTITRLLAVAMVVVLYIHYFFPQSWGFYTIESNIPLYNIYPVHNGIADKSPLIKNNMSYGMGISMKGKILYNELYSIINNKNLPWKILKADSLNNIARDGGYIVISTGTENNIFSGKFLITKTGRPTYLTLTHSENIHALKQYILADIR